MHKDCAIALDLLTFCVLYTYIFSHLSPWLYNVLYTCVYISLYTTIVCYFRTHIRKLLTIDSPAYLLNTIHMYIKYVCICCVLLCELVINLGLK